MKLNKSVYSKIFIGCTTFSIANIFMPILWLFGLKNIEVVFYASGLLGMLIAFLLDKKINTIPYDEYDNYNKIFFVFMLLALILLIGQGVFFDKLKR